MCQNVLKLPGAQFPATDEISGLVNDHVQSGRGIEVVRNGHASIATIDSAYSRAIDVLMDRCAESGSASPAVATKNSEGGRMLELTCKL